MSDEMIQYNLTETEKTFNTVKNMLSDHFKNVAINIIEWKRKNGKPISSICAGLTSQMLEKFLYENGKAIFCKDDLIGFLALKVAPANKVNVYGKPTNFRAIGWNYNKEYNIDNSVIINNNSLQKATAEIIDYYCTKLADIELTKDLNRNALKMPYILETTEDTMLSAKNTWKKINSTEPVIYKNKSRSSADGIGVSVQNNGVPAILDKLEDDYNCYVAKILTVLGLDNYVEDKKERVQSAEVDSQQEYIISNFRPSLRERQEACDKINEMFGLDLMVDYVKAEQIETEEDNESDEEANEDE